MVPVKRHQCRRPSESGIYIVDGSLKTAIASMAVILFRWRNVRLDRGRDENLEVSQTVRCVCARTAFEVLTMPLSLSGLNIPFEFIGGMKPGHRWYQSFDPGSSKLLYLESS